VTQKTDHFRIGVDLKWRLIRTRKKQADFPNNIIRWLISRILLFVLPQKVNKKLQKALRSAIPKQAWFCFHLNVLFKADFYPQAPSSEKLSSAGDFLLSSELPACSKLFV
jgi:hypothetical protein